MTRPTGVFKVPSRYLTERDSRRAFEEISKAAWADLYADLYRQTHGEEATEADIVADARKRLGILKGNGIR